MKKHGVSPSNLIGMVFLAALAFSASAMAAQHYSFQTVDPPFGQPGVDINVENLWINDFGIITAQFQAPFAFDPLENAHTAILERGQWTLIDIPGALSTTGTNASNRGQVVLTRKPADGVWRCATYYRGRFQLFPEFPGYPGGIIAQGHNDLGQIVAVVIDGAGVSHGFVGTQRDFTIFDYPAPGATSVMPLMLNDRGVTVGGYTLADGSGHAFRLENGAFQNVDPPQATPYAQAAGVNNAGVIVGLYVNYKSEIVGFVREGTQYADLVVPQASYTLPTCINDRGQISGIYTDGSFVTHGFVATPVTGG
jgi:hypothetical protein